MPDRVPVGLTITDLDRDRRTFATVGEAACILRWDPRTVRKLIAAGQIPAIHGDGAYRIPVAWLRDEAYRTVAAAG